jgi:hypothetical protein
MRLLLAAALGVVAAWPAWPARAEPPRRVELPIREVVLSDGARRYTVPLQVGGTTIEAGLDTGSTGLRILPSTLGAGDVRESSEADTYAYGSGARFEGVIGRATVGFGPLSGTSTVQVIRKVGCVEQKPNCPANRIPLAQYGIQGDGLPGEGFKAILGANMAHAPAENPLAAVGAARWIVELPRPGEGRPGRLVLNPADDEVRDYVRLKLLPNFREQRGGMHDAVAGCLVNEAAQARACGALLMDTGAPGLDVVNGKLGGTPWAPGTPATLVLAEPDGQVRAAEKLTIGLRQHASRLNYSQEPRFTGTILRMGLSPYFAFSVLYDPSAGEIGVKPRAPTPDSPRGQVVVGQP